MAETYSVTVSGVALSAATARTVIEVAAGATAKARTIALDVSFKNGVSTQNAEVLVELVRYATTGTGTAYTPLKCNGEAQNAASLCTAKTSDTVEPATPTVVKSWYVPATAAQMIQLPLGRETYIPPSTVVGLRVTSPNALTCAANFEFEE